MARKTMMMLLAPALATPACLETGLTKDPLMPLPSMYAEDWRACAKACDDNLACHKFSFKKDSEPTPGACWQFTNPYAKTEADPSAVSGPKGCEFHSTAAEAVAAAQDGVNAAANGVNAAANGVNAAAASISDGVTGAANAAADTIKGTVNGKSLAVGTGGGTDHTLLYCILGGSAAAALIGAGGYMMMSGEKKKKKRSVKPKAPVDEESAPLAPAMAVSAELPPTNAMVPQPMHVQYPEYPAYQPAYQPATTYAMPAYQPAYQPATYQPGVYMQ